MRNLPKYSFTVPNEIRLIGWLYYQSVLTSCLTLSLKTNLSAFFKTEFSTQLAKKMNKSGYIWTSDFVPASKEGYPLITSNFLFRFTRNAWTTETSTIPYWNWEELNLKTFFFSSVAHRSSDSFLFRLVSGAYTRTSKLFSNTSRLFWFNARNEVDRGNFSIYRG